MSYDYIISLLQTRQEGWQWVAAGAAEAESRRGRGRPAAAEECQQQEGSNQRGFHAVLRGRSAGAPEPPPEDPAAASPEPPSDHRRQTTAESEFRANKLLRPEDAVAAGPRRGSAGNATKLIQGDPSPRGLGWDVPLSCMGSTAAAVQPNGLWNIPNQSQPNPGPQGDGSPCTFVLLLISQILHWLLQYTLQSKFIGSMYELQSRIHTELNNK